MLSPSDITGRKICMTSSCEIVNICQSGNLRKLKSSKGNDKLSSFLTCNICCLILSCSRTKLTGGAKHIKISACDYNYALKESFSLWTKINQDKRGEFFKRRYVSWCCVLIFLYQRRFFAGYRYLPLIKLGAVILVHVQNLD